MLHCCLRHQPTLFNRPHSFRGNFPRNLRTRPILDNFLCTFLFAAHLFVPGLRFDCYVEIRVAGFTNKIISREDQESNGYKRRELYLWKNKFQFSNTTMKLSIYVCCNFTWRKKKGSETFLAFNYAQLVMVLLKSKRVERNKMRFFQLWMTAESIILKRVSRM